MTQQDPICDRGNQQRGRQVRRLDREDQTMHHNRKISRTKEGASGENGYNERPLGRSDAVAVGEGCRDRNGVTERAEPVRHLLDTRNGTSIITEEDASESSETCL